MENTVLSKRVAAASVLKTTSVKSSGVRYKNSGRETETNKASSVQKIKTCFTILENTVTTAGSKDVFVKITAPDGSVMTNNSETFTVGGQASLYTVKDSFDYDNKETNMCIYWEKGSPFAQGKYTIEVYCEGTMIAGTSVELK